MANKFHIETYTMPVGCNSWIAANSFSSSPNEEQVYTTWKGVVKEVQRDYPKARVIRTLNRRSVKEAFNDRESSICSREWELSPADGKFRVTMYVTKAA